MVDAERIDVLAAETVSPIVVAILRHLCQEPCHTFGAVLEWCEARGDCAQAIVCPVCSTQYVVDDDELTELLRWTDDRGQALVCGVRWN